MTSESSYRLYPWLALPLQRLLQLNKNKLPHAFLFCGPSGLGKKALVFAFAQYVLCQAPTVNGACGSCRACQLFQTQHPDFLCAPFESVGIDDVRELTHFLEEASHQQGKKVIALFEVDKLPIQCANALLKTIEEPPSDAVILLVSNKPFVLPTLKSRCFLVNLPLPSLEEALGWLKQTLPQAQEATLEKCLYLAGGAPVLAQTYYENKEAVSSLLDQLAKGELSTFDSEEIQQFILSSPLLALYLIYYFFTDFLTFMLIGKAGILYNESQISLMAQLSNRLSYQKITHVVDMISDAIKTITKPGVNKSLLFESLFCEWQLICQKGKAYEHTRA